MPRVRTPTPLKKARGNPGKRPYNKREPELPPGAPRMPDGLDELGEQEWKRTVAEALQMKVLTTVDRGVLEKRARAYSTWIRAERELEKNGLTYETTNQNGSAVIKANPAAAIAADAWRRYKAATVELGMTPAARSRVSTVDPTEEAANPEGKYFQ